MAKDNTVNASLTISFKAVVEGEAEGEGTLKLEVVDTDQSDGDTDFVFGDNPIFRQYKSPSVSITERIVSDDGASISNAGSGTTTIEDEIITFSNSKTASTQYPIKEGSLSVEVLGGNIGSSFSKTGPTEITAKNPSNKDHPIGVVKVSYKADFTKHKLSGVKKPAGLPAGEDYPVLVYVFGTVGG